MIDDCLTDWYRRRRRSEGRRSLQGDELDASDLSVRVPAFGELVHYILTLRTGLFYAQYILVLQCTVHCTASRSTSQLHVKSLVKLKKIVREKWKGV